MKNKLILIWVTAIVIFAFTYKQSNKIDSPYPYPVEQWQKVGSSEPARMDYKRLKQIFIKVTPTQANGGTVDISALGLTTIMTKQISAQRNNNNAYDVPQVAFKTVTPTSVSYSIVQGSNAVVSVLGVSVLSGPSTIFATDLANIEINIMITGY